MVMSHGVSAYCLLSDVFFVPLYEIYDTPVFKTNAYHADYVKDILVFYCDISQRLMAQKRYCICQEFH